LFIFISDYFYFKAAAARYVSFFYRHLSAIWAFICLRSRPLPFALFGGAGGAGGAGQSQVKSRDALEVRLPFYSGRGITFYLMKICMLNA